MKLTRYITPLRKVMEHMEDIYNWREFYKTLSFGMIVSLTIFFNKLILLIVMAVALVCKNQIIRFFTS